MRDQRVTSMVLVPQALDLFWSAIEREVDRPAGAPASTACGGSRGPCPIWARRLALPERPRAARRRAAAVRVRRGVPAAGAPAGVGGPRRHRPPGLRRDRVAGPARARPSSDHGLGTVGRPPAGIEMRIAEDGEIQFRARRCSRATGTTRHATADAFTDDGWYRSGDIGHLDAGGRLVLSGPQEGHDRPAQRLQRLSRGHRERPADRRASATRSCSRRGPAGSRRSSSRPGSHGLPRAGAGGRASTRPCPRTRFRAADRRRRQSRQRPPRPEPAARRLAALARGRLPADPHASRSSATRSGPGPGPTRRSRFADPRGARNAAASPNAAAARARRQPGTVTPVPMALERGLDARGAASPPPGDQVKKIDRPSPSTRIVNRVSPAKNTRPRAARHVGRLVRGRRRRVGRSDRSRTGRSKRRRGASCGVETERRSAAAGGEPLVPRAGRYGCWRESAASETSRSVASAWMTRRRAAAVTTGGAAAGVTPAGG